MSQGRGNGKFGELNLSRSPREGMRQTTARRASTTRDGASPLFRDAFQPVLLMPDLFSQRPAEKRPRDCPVPLDRRHGDSEGLGRLFNAQAGEVPQLNHAHLSFVELCQPIEGVVQFEHIDRVRFRLADVGRQRDPFAAVAFQLLPGARMIDEEPPHGLRGDAEEVVPVLPRDTLLAEEAENASCTSSVGCQV